MLLKLLCLNVALKVLDLATTIWAVGKTGNEIEANPVMKYALDNLGYWAYLANFSVFFLAVLLLYRKKGKVSLILVAGMMAIVVINNIIACLHILGVM